MKEHIIKILVLAGVFCLGAGGGIWAQAFLLPFLASHPAFSSMQFIKDWNERATIVRETREVFVSKEEVFSKVLERTKDIAVAIQSSGAGGATRGSGFIATSDGFLLTLAEIVPQGNSVSVFLRPGEAVEAQVLKRDFESGLALLKIPRENLPTAGFADISEVKPGQNVLLAAKTQEEGELLVLANQGSVRMVAQDQIRTNIFEKASLRGSPLFDMAGNLVGIATMEADGRVAAIPSFLLREFSGL